MGQLEFMCWEGDQGGIDWAGHSYARIFREPHPSRSPCTHFHDMTFHVFTSH